MTSRKFLTQDNYTTAICLSLIVIGYFALVNDYSFFKINNNKRSSHHSIGKITIVKSDARVRSSKNVLWSNAQIEDLVDHGDSLFVGPDSKIEISFNDGKSIIIGSNSLVKFNTENKKVKLNLEYGSLKSQNLPTQLVLDDCGQALDIQSSQGDLEIGKSNHCGKIKVKSEKGVVKINNKVLTKTTKNEPIIIAPPPIISLIEKPQVNLDILRLEAEKAAAYKAAEEQAEKLRLAELAARDKNFVPAEPMIPEPLEIPEEPLNQEPMAEQTPVNPNLEQKVETITQQPEPQLTEEPPALENTTLAENLENKNEEVIPQQPLLKPEIKPLSAPKIKKMKSKIDVTLNRLPVAKWEPVEEADEYILQVSTDPEFKKYETFKTIETEKVIKIKGEEKVYYRLQSSTFDDRLSDFSKIAVIEYNYPAISLNNKIQSFDYYAQSPKDRGTEKDFSINWSEVPNAKKYIVEIDSNSEFKNPQKIVTRSPSSIVKVPSSGRYNYRVSAYNAKDRQISSSSDIGEIIYNRIFDVKSPSIEKSYQAMTYFFQKGLGRYIWLKWSGQSNKNSKFRVEIARDSEFRNIFKSYTTPKNKLLLQDELNKGQYFWRVRTETVNNGQLQYSDWSNRASIEVSSGQK